MRNLVWLLMILELISAAGAPWEARAEVLTLSRALELARENHPELARARAETEAALAEARQAGAWDNPGLFFRLEAAPRDGDAWRGSERIWGLSQDLPLWGARSKVREAGQAAAGVLRHREDLTAQELAARVRLAHARAVWAGGLVSLREESVQVMQQLEALVRRRVEAGDASRAALDRANLAAARAEVSRNEAATTLDKARGTLAQLLGLPDLAGWELPGWDHPPALDIDTPAPATGRDSVREALLQARTQAARAEVDAARVLRLPGLELEAGLRTSPERDAFDVGVRLELPLWNRGQAAVQAARARQAAVEYGVQADRLQRAARLREADREVAAAQEALRTYGERIVPRARQALQALQAAYALGDVSLTEVLQVTGEWIDVRSEELLWRRRLAEARASRVAWN